MKTTEELFIENISNYLSKYSKDKLLITLESPVNQIREDLKDQFIRFYILSKPLSSGVSLAVNFCKKYLPDNPAPNIDDIVVYLLKNYINSTFFPEDTFKEQVIEKDTLVWFRDYDDQNWQIGYYSHFDNVSKKHHSFKGSKKSTEIRESWSWEILTTENPLK
jgi:hypothetical protein